jgi:predicted esterase
MMIATLLALVLAEQDAKKPAFQPGTNDVTFVSSPELCDADEVQARFRASDKIPPYDVKNEKFKLIIPKSYVPAAKWGLFVFINADDSPGIPGEYEPILERRKLIAIAPYKAGNNRNIFDRFRLAVDAAVNLQKPLAIDSTRIYVSGFSGGARVSSMLAVAYADLFSGAIPLCGVNFYTEIPSEPGKHWPVGYIPVKEALAIAKPKGRYVLVTGEKDFNLANTKAVYEQGFKKEGFKYVKLLEVPGMGHSPAPAEWFDRGLEFLDKPK